jgi:hypothetical protein
MIAGWKSDLSKILLVFNVSSAVVAWLPLTVHSQTELALNTHTIVSGMDHNVSNMDQNVKKIHAIVSNIDSTVMKIQEGADSKNLLVSTTFEPHLSPDERSQLLRPELGRQFRLPMDPASDVCI